MKRLLATLMIAAGLATVLVGPALATSTETLNVDGIEYVSYRNSGKAFHFNTPDTNPTSAFIVGGHTWAGNGSENLPCEGGIHWIDNKNVLTVSNCLEVPEETTTTTEPDTSTTTTIVIVTTTLTPTTTTSIPATTTTSATTTTEQGTSTTTDPSTTTTADPCDKNSPNWVEDTQTCELPNTGMSGLFVFVVLGLLAVLGGATAINLTKRFASGKV